jgi:hypothetical protein
MFVSPLFSFPLQADMCLLDQVRRHKQLLTFVRGCASVPSTCQLFDRSYTAACMAHESSNTAVISKQQYQTRDPISRSCLHMLRWKAGRYCQPGTPSPCWQEHSIECHNMECTALLTSLLMRSSTHMQDAKPSFCSWASTASCA